ncbi:MAG: hypothetical protein L0211_12725 [Planctomycetaceae bacterium]|nr:hypothetical protein [Planctomycetaceae bacterium]
MSTEFDTQIAEHRRDIAALEPQMNDYKMKFVAAAGKFIEDWYWQKAGEIAKRKDAHTASLGQREVDEIKEEVKTLQSKASQLVNKTVNAGRLWWSDSQSEFIPHGKPAGIDNLLRNIAGQLAIVLQRHGYISGDTRYPSESWYLVEGPGPAGERHYDGEFNWSPEMNQAMADYCKLAEQANEMLRKISQLEQAKIKKRAADLWDAKT